MLVNATTASGVHQARDAVEDFEARFGVLYRRAYGVAYVIVGERAEAEDVAQEALARLVVRWRRAAPYADAWVVRVAGNLAIDRIRRRARQALLPAAAPREPDATRVDLQRALLGLTKRQREVVVLRYVADLPEVEVARLLGCSTGSVKTHAVRGLAALRTALVAE
jgi:RNA polymerase sigma factor (sigma-70 family)